MSKMLADYDHLLRLDSEEEYRIPLTGAEDFIFTAGREYWSLDGLWHYTPDVFDTFLRKKFFAEQAVDEEGRALPVDYSFEDWEQVKVPSNWNMTAEKLFHYEGSVIYTRTFCYEEIETLKANKKQVFLKLDGVNYETKLWLNGQLLARHRGGFTPFFTDLTPALRKENRIFIQINNRRENDQVPALNYDWFNYGGISRSIKVFEVPEVFIKDFYIRLLPDGKFSNYEVDVTLSRPLANQECQIILPERNLAFTAFTDSAGKATITFSAQLALWSPENPCLHKVQVSSGEDKITDRVGFREIRSQGRELFLNGKPLFLRGICCHEEDEKSGRVLTETQRRQIFHLAAELKANTLRLAHYPHDEEMAKLADELGFLLWEEVPVYWALAFDNPKTQFDAENQLEELLLRDRNRASVIIWSVGNENPDTDERLAFMCKLLQKAKALDTTRLLSAACLVNVDHMAIVDRLMEFVDVVAINEYYGWYYRSYDGIKKILDHSNLSKPLVISETGAGALWGHHGGEEELFTEEHQAKTYRKQIAYTEGRVQGFFPWIMFDFRTQIRLNDFQRGFNRKGLLAADKEKRKQAFFVLRDYYQRLEE